MLSIALLKTTITAISSSLLSYYGIDKLDKYSKNKNVSSGSKVTVTGSGNTINIFGNANSTVLQSEEMFKILEKLPEGTISKTEIDQFKSTIENLKIDIEKTREIYKGVKEWLSTNSRNLINEIQQIELIDSKITNSSERTFFYETLNIFLQKIEQVFEKGGPIFVTVKEESKPYLRLQIELYEIAFAYIISKAKKEETIKVNYIILREVFNFLIYKLKEEVIMIQ